MKTLFCIVFFVINLSLIGCAFAETQADVKNWANSSQTISDMNLIAAAMTQNLTEFGLPSNSNEVNWLLVLTGENPRKIPYLSKSALNPLSRDKLLCDQWGHPYRFFSGVIAGSMYMQSAGANGVFDYAIQSDDIIYVIRWNR